jgi:predicted cupin superfamily sugar epimerase
MFQIPVLVTILAAALCASPSMAAPSNAVSLDLPLTQRSGNGHPTNCGINGYSAQDVVKKLGLIPNEEKGYYIQTFEDDLKVANNRSASTLIYYLLEGKVGSSYWHRVDSVEVWHYYAGAPLTLSLSYNDGKKVDVKTLGPDIFHGQAPQVPIGKWQWQSAKSLGAWTLVGTTGKFVLHILYLTYHETMFLSSSNLSPFPFSYVRPSSFLTRDS